MKRLIPTAALAVFFSLSLSGCYTQFGRPGPETGERTRYRDYDYTYDYYDDYYYWGYLSPWSYGYPYYSYGFFYSPWWYDQIYYYYYPGDDYRAGSKFIRSRSHDYTPSPMPPSSGVIVNPPSQPSGGEVRIKSGNDSAGGSDKGSQAGQQQNSQGKSTRTRR